MGAAIWPEHWRAPSYVACCRTPAAASQTVGSKGAFMIKHDFEVTIKKGELLGKLRENRDRHVKMCKEANEGFLKKAREELKARLELAEKGCVKRLSITLTPPADHTAEYETAIEMADMHQGDVMVLDAATFRNLVQDEWDWVGGWLSQNRQYSTTASSYSSEKMHLLRD